jgi:hypothetical protein
MRRLSAYVAFTILMSALVACTPADPTTGSPTPAPAEAGNEEEVVAQPTATPLPARATATDAPAATSTPAELEVEITPEATAKPEPVQEIRPAPDGAPAVPPSDPYSLELIDAAKADLSQQLNIPAEEIVLVSFEYVTWPNAALGCPKPGMAYADVLVDGYLIMLQISLDIYNYHGATGGSGPFLCEGGLGTKIIVPPPSW